MSDSESENLEIYSMAWGLTLAELSWLFSHWVVGYAIFGISSIAIPQVSIIVTVLSFLIFTIFLSKEDDDKIKFQEIILPVIFSLGICFVVMTFFSGLPTS